MPIKIDDHSSKKKPPGVLQIKKIREKQGQGKIEVTQQHIILRKRKTLYRNCWVNHLD